MNWNNTIHSLKYQRSTTSGYKDKGITKSEFETRTQFLYKDYKIRVCDKNSIPLQRLQNQSLRQELNSFTGITTSEFVTRTQFICKDLKNIREIFLNQKFRFWKYKL